MNQGLKFTLCICFKSNYMQPKQLLHSYTLSSTDMIRLLKATHPSPSFFDAWKILSLWPAPTQPSYPSAPNGQTGQTVSLCQNYSLRLVYTLTTIQTLTYRLIVRLRLQVPMLMDAHPAFVYEYLIQHTHAHFNSQQTWEHRWDLSAW